SPPICEGVPEMTATKTRTRKPAGPATGTVRVLRPIGSVNDRTGEVAINDTAYYVERFATGYRLTRFDPKKGGTKTDDLPAHLSSCDCEDATFCPERPGGCKHRRAMQALVGRGQL